MRAELPTATLPHAPPAAATPTRTARVLIAHNRYRIAGGEDSVVANETRLLRDRGHEVLEYVVDNASIGRSDALRVAAGAVWSTRARRELRALLRDAAVDVVHFHNTLPLISPAAYSVCGEVGVAVVQTLHNYRLLCPNGLLFRGGRVCEACVGRIAPWPAVRHGCYRDSRAQSAVVATMIAAHRARGTWDDDVDAFIALTEFARRKFVGSGLPASRVHVKPNFVDAPSLAPSDAAARDAFLYVGRLSSEKGVETLLRAWTAMDVPPRLRIAGTGPLQPLVEDAADTCPAIEYIGQVDRMGVRREMLAARALVLPSECYEGFPVTLVEAFSCGLPVISAHVGSLPDIIGGEAGTTFTPGDADDLARQVRAVAGDAAWSRRGRAAYSTYLADYTADANYAALMRVYERAMARARRARSTRRSLPVVHGADADA